MTRYLHLAIAGNGDPIAIRHLLSDKIREQVLCLHQSRVPIYRGDDPNIDHLVDLRVATVENEVILPGIFVADQAQAIQVSVHAFGLATTITSIIERHLPHLARDYSRQSIALSRSFGEMAFLYIGDLLLDTGLLDLLAEDGVLMPPAPLRQFGTISPARFYCWLIEGDPHLLGGYGQREIALRWDDWALVTFGQYAINGERNLARDAVIDHVLRAQSLAGDHQKLAAACDIPVIDQRDLAAWSRVIRPVIQEIVDVYRQSARDLEALCQGIATGGKSLFAEFFCWYNHLAYAHVIEQLESHGMLIVPRDRFATAIVETGKSSGAFSSLR